MSSNSVRVGTYRMLDVYRGIASLGVVAFHWGEISLRRQPELTGNPIYIASAYGFLGVQIFFVISGYCIAAAAVALLRREDSLWSYFVARARRIYPVYWAALLFATAFYEVSTQLARRGLIPNNVLTQDSVFDRGWLYHFANITLTAVPLEQSLRVEVAWTLCYEVAFYVIVGIALALCARHPGRLLTLLHLLTITTMGALLIQPQHLPFPLDLWPHFGLGVFLFDLLAFSGEPEPSKRRNAVVTGFAICLGMYAAFVALYDVPIGYLAQDSRMTFAVAGAFALFLLVMRRYDAIWSEVTLMRRLAFIGVYSYSLYLVHLILLRIWNQLWQKLHLPGSWHLLAFLMAFVLSVGFAYGFFLLFERPTLKRKAKATI